MVCRRMVDFAVEIDATDLATALSAHFPVDAPVVATPTGGATPWTAPAAAVRRRSEPEPSDPAC